MDKLRYQLIHRLWNSCASYGAGLAEFLVSQPLVIDHIAILDFKSKYTGIHVLKRIFEMLDMQGMGSGYLPSKQNSFSWMAHPESFERSPTQAMAQIVIADFDHEKLSLGVQNIIEKYSNFSRPFDENKLFKYISKIKAGDVSFIEPAVNLLVSYILTTDWPTPDLRDYQQVFEENQLLAWVLLFGRRVNHFGLGVYTNKKFKDLDQFNNFLKTQHHIKFNENEGMIKGGKHVGIAQSSTIGQLQAISLNGGLVKSKGSFVEFVWRYLRTTVAGGKPPHKLGDYFCGFIPANADNVIESVYE